MRTVCLGYSAIEASWFFKQVWQVYMSWFEATGTCSEWKDSSAVHFRIIMSTHNRKNIWQFRVRIVVSVVNTIQEIACQIKNFLSSLDLMVYGSVERKTRLTIHGSAFRSERVSWHSIGRTITRSTWPNTSQDLQFFQKYIPAHKQNWIQNIFRCSNILNEIFCYTEKICLDKYRVGGYRVMFMRV